MLCPDASWYGLFKRLFYLCSDSSNPVPVLCKPKWNQLGEHVDYAWQCVKSCLLTDDESGEGCSRAFCKKLQTKRLWNLMPQSTISIDITGGRAKTCLGHDSRSCSSKYPIDLLQIKWEFLFLLQNICMLSQSAGCFSGVTKTTRSLFPNRP